MVPKHMELCVELSHSVGKGGSLGRHSGDFPGRVYFADGHPRLSAHTPEGQKMKKRPRDPNALAKSIVDIATGQAEDREPKSEKSEAAAEMGRKGGKARAQKLSEEKRREIAERAAAKRWAKSD